MSLQRCISYTPSQFASMSIDEKERAQRQQAQCLFALSEKGTNLQPYEADYVTRILGKVPVTITNTATSAGQATGCDGYPSTIAGTMQCAFKNILDGIKTVGLYIIIPLMVIAVVFYVVPLFRKPA